MGLEALQAAEQQAGQAEEAARSAMEAIGRNSEMEFEVDGLGRLKINLEPRPGQWNDAPDLVLVIAEGVEHNGDIYRVVWRVGESRMIAQRNTDDTKWVSKPSPEMGEATGSQQWEVWQTVRDQIWKVVQEDYLKRPEVKAKQAELWVADQRRALAYNEWEQRNLEYWIGKRKGEGKRRFGKEEDALEEAKAKHGELALKARSGSQEAFEVLREIRRLTPVNWLAAADLLAQEMAAGRIDQGVLLVESWPGVKVRLETGAEYAGTPAQRSAAQAKLEELQTVIGRMLGEDEIEAATMEGL